MRRWHSAWWAFPVFYVTRWWRSDEEPEDEDLKEFFANKWLPETLQRNLCGAQFVRTKLVRNSIYSVTINLLYLYSLAKRIFKGVLDKIKLWMEQMVSRVGFFGILLFASIPNPFFDLAGITCGHFLIPFGHSLAPHSLERRSLKYTFRFPLFYFMKLYFGLFANDLQA